jgi:two-component system alkaline phosphatase synthesis response regulator PhoP
LHEHVVQQRACTDAKARRFQPDVVVLDIMLPGLDGLEVLRRLRSESSAYIVMLTAKAEETDKVVGLSVGADDYVTKPFSPRELTARIHAILRRERGPGQARALTFRTLRIDPARREAWKDDARVDLTTREFDLLYALASYPGHVLSREQLIARVWGADYFGDDRVVDAQVKDLRRKLGDDPGRCPADIFSNVTPVKTSSRQCRRLCGERNANPESQSRICPSVGSVIRSNPRREHQCHPG